MSEVWLIGHPVAHSLSPAMHNAAFAKLGLPHRYEARDVEEKDLAGTLDRMRRADVLGVNVTIPHKEAALRLVDEASEEARRVGALNTIVVRGGRLIGENTDKYGFEKALSDSGHTDSSGFMFAMNTVVVLGAGGAARACVLALLQHENSVIVANRDPARAEALVRAMEPFAVGDRTITVGPWPEGRFRADGVVNATPLGLGGEDPLERAELPVFVVDLVPTAVETPLVKRAKATEYVTVVDGLSMLLHQAARSFELWTGTAAPLEVMRAALPRRA